MKNKIVLSFFIILLIFLIILCCIYRNLKKDTTYSQSKNINNLTLESIIENCDCTYKKQKKSSEKEYVYDIYVIFKYNLYDDDSNNEEYYNTIIEEISKFLNYVNFRLIDNTKDEETIIEVVCENSKIKKIYINGLEDYFIYMDSQKELSNYTKYDISTFNVSSSELKKCIDKDWNCSIDFGKKESIFEGYHIYFDEGIEVRIIGRKIYNIIFTNKYQSEVIENIKVGMDKSTIKAFLGEPTYTNSDETIIGYKTDTYYAFFENNQISVYRNDSINSYDEFIELVNKRTNNEYTLREFMNNLTYLWNDYSDYEYDYDYAYISYPNKGIEIKINYDNTNGILLYNNIGMEKDKYTKCLEGTEYIAKLSVDCVFEAEERRVEKINKYADECYKYYKENESENSKNRGSIYDYYVKLDNNNIISNMYFISKIDGYFNCQLNETVNSYYWYNDYILIYSKKNSGIYYYNLVSQKKGIIVEGEDEFEIKSIDKDGLIQYDEKNIKIE